MKTILNETLYHFDKKAAGRMREWLGKRGVLEPGETTASLRMKTYEERQALYGSYVSDYYKELKEKNPFMTSSQISQYISRVIYGSD